MKFPVIDYDNSLFLILMIDGDDYIHCVTKDGELDVIGMASYNMPLDEALPQEGFNIVKHQTLKEFLEC